MSNDIRHKHTVELWVTKLYIFHASISITSSQSVVPIRESYSMNCSWICSYNWCCQIHSWQILQCPLHHSIAFESWLGDKGTHGLEAEPLQGQLVWTVNLYGNCEFCNNSPIYSNTHFSDMDSRSVFTNGECHCHLVNWFHYHCQVNWMDGMIPSQFSAAYKSSCFCIHVIPRLDLTHVTDMSCSW